MKVAVTPRGTQHPAVLKTCPDGGILMHEVGLIGGTFDCFHKGHAILLERSLDSCEHLEVWLTTDSIAQSKDSRISSWNARCQDIREKMGDVLSERLSFGLLEEIHGPAPFHSEAGAIACTTETRSTCEEINSIRLQNKLQPLEIIELEHELAWDGEPISSSRIRNGEIDREGMPWIPDSFRGGKMVLTPEVEILLKKPFGQLILGPEEDPSVAMGEVITQIESEWGPVIAVGDVTVRTMQDLGRPADIALIDGLTRREPWDGSSGIDSSIYDFTLSCESPAGCLTPSLLEACETAICSWTADRATHLVEVEGEEDLAPLVLHPLAPLGAVVLYGQPGKGVVIRRCTEDSKISCRNLLNCFESAY